MDLQYIHNGIAGRYLDGVLLVAKIPTRTNTADGHKNPQITNPRDVVAILGRTIRERPHGNERTAYETFTNPSERFIEGLRVTALGLVF